MTLADHGAAALAKKQLPHHVARAELIQTTDGMASQRNSNTAKYAYTIAVIALLSIFAVLLNTYLGGMISSNAPGLEAYLPYLSKAIYIILGILGCYLVYRVLLSILIPYAMHSGDSELAEITKLALRIVFYVIVIFLILTASGISLSAALAGGAIGGIVLGLAVQNIVTSILSGLMLSWSRTLIPGDLMLVHSWMFGPVDIVCKVVKVNTVFTEVVTQHGQDMRIPSNILLNTTVFTKLGRGRNISYAFQVLVNADTPSAAVQKYAESGMQDAFKNMRLAVPKAYFTSKTGSQNAFTVIAKFNDITEVNEILNAVNKSFDAAYNRAKA